MSKTWIYKMSASFLCGSFFATAINLFLQSFLESRHPSGFEIELWGLTVLIMTLLSFLLLNSIFRNIEKYGKSSVLITLVLCVLLGGLVLKIVSDKYIIPNNLMVFVSIPGWNSENNMGIQITEIKKDNRAINLKKFQISKGCRLSENAYVVCGNFSIIEYIYENEEAPLPPVNILLSDRGNNNSKNFSLNPNEIFSYNNIFQSPSFWVIWISHSLIKLMVGLLLGIFVFSLLSFTNFIDLVQVQVNLNLSRAANISSWDVFVAIIFMIFTLIYLWLSTGGTMYKLYPTTYYYNYLADAFLHRQTNLLIEPTKEILALPDPYDPQANVKWRLHDASLYNGKYYLYWGPTPALILSVFNYLFPGYMIRDQLLVLVFVIGIFFFLMRLILIIARELFNNIPKWVIFIGFVVFGLAISQTWLLGRPFIYEAAISGGQFFLLSGLYCAYIAFEKGSPKKLLLVLAGTFWALAIGSRATQVAAVACLFLLTTWKILRTAEKKYVFEWKSLLALSLPLITGIFLLLWYNYARFGSVMETGVSYVLAGQRVENTFELDHIIPSLYYYFVRFSTIKIESQFPFIDTMKATAELISLPKSYVGSGVVTVGLLWVFPFVWIIPISLICGFYFRKSMTYQIKDAINTSKLIWFGLGLLGATMALLPQLLFLGAPMRYFADFLPGVGLLSFFIFCFLYSNLNDHPKMQTSLSIIFLFLAVSSSIFGFLLGINSENGFTLFANANPPLFNWLVEHFHF